MERVASAAVFLDEEGAVMGANDAALELLRVPIGTLVEAPPGAFAVQRRPDDERAALRAQWESAGRPDVGGETTIRRGDGSELRARYLVIPQVPQGFTVLLEPLPSGWDDRDRLVTLGDVLREWRAAERRLQELDENAADADTLRAEVERLRTRYQLEFSQRQRR